MTEKKKTTDGGETAGDDRPRTLPPESVEQGASASSFEPNPDAPEDAVAQIEVLPDEK